MGQGRLEGLRTEQIRSDVDRPPPPAALLSTAASRIFAAMLVWNCADVRSLTCNPACNPLTAEMPEKRSNDGGYRCHAANTRTHWRWRVNLFMLRAKKRRTSRTARRAISLLFPGLVFLSLCALLPGSAAAITSSLIPEPVSGGDSGSGADRREAPSPPAYGGERPGQLPGGQTRSADRIRRRYSNSPGSASWTTRPAA